MLKLLISCWYDGVVEACRYMFAMGSDVVLVLLLLYCTVQQYSTELMAPWRWFKCKPKHVGGNYFNKLKFYSVKWKSVHVLVIIVDTDNRHDEKLKKNKFLTVYFTFIFRLGWNLL